MEEQEHNELIEKREKLSKNKEFLLSLITTAAKVKRIITNADNSEISTLLSLLHWFACGEITIDKSLHKKIKRSLSASIFRKHFVSQQGFDKLINYSRSKKIDVINSLRNIIPSFIRILQKE